MSGPPLLGAWEQLDT